MSPLTVISRQQVEEGPFDRQCLIPGWDQARLRDAKIMVAGAGAIGNEVVKNLALLGAGYLFIVDQDVIATSNLSRTVLFGSEDVEHSKAEVAARRARQLCLEPLAQVDWFHGDLVRELGTGVYRRMNLVLGCVDNLEARLAVNRQCRLAGVPWIDAGIHELACYVSAFPVGAEACFECGVSPAQMARSWERSSCDVFRRREVAAGRLPTTQITSALVAALQVQEGVKLLCGQPVVPGERLYFQGAANDYDRLRLTARDGCLAHEEFVEPTALALSADDTLRAFLERVSREDAAGPGCRLDLSGEPGFVIRARCRRCLSRWVELMAPTFRIFEDEVRCDDCRRQPAAAQAATAERGEDFEMLSTYALAETPAAVQDLTLYQLGVPRLAVLPVAAADGSFHFYELAGDTNRVLPGLPIHDQRR